MTARLSPQREAEIAARATNERLTPGPWRLEYESCDCSDGYCHHGAYVAAVATPVPTPIAAERLARTGEKPRDYDFSRTDMGDFSDVDWELMAHARADVPALLAELAAVRAERDCLAMAVLFARQWRGGTPFELHQGIDEVLATMPSGGEDITVAGETA